MDNGEINGRTSIGYGKLDGNMYGERIIEDSSSFKKPNVEIFEDDSLGAKRDIVWFKNRRRAAESVKAQAESELVDAKKTVKELSLLIEESNVKAKSRLHDVRMLRKTSRREEREFGENAQYAEVMRELEFVKQELSRLKMDMASVLEGKSQAEKEIETSNMKMKSYSSSVEAFRKEIEEVNEEQVLVELARIEALKEYGTIQVYRENEANRFTTEMEKTRMKMKEIIEEMDHSKELETKLAVTMTDVDVLQNELKQVKDMDRKIDCNDSSKQSPLLQSAIEELEAAKKELASVREEGFQFMASMDIIRNELKHVTEETARLNITEAKAEVTIQNLNSKLLRAKSKLEAVSAAEGKAKSILSNLTLTLEQSKTETEAAKKEKELISEETEKIKEELQKTESQLDISEEKLQAAMQELEAVKSSEALALENLKTLTISAMQARASASRHSSSITISRFEYEYLTGSAVAAEEIADKKVAAAQAWIEALKSSEREILMKSEIAQREIRELQVEEQQVYRMQRSKREKGLETPKLNRALSRRSKDNGNMTPGRRGKVRKPASPVAWATPKSSSFTMKKKRRAMPNLSKLFSGKKIENDH